MCNALWVMFWNWKWKMVVCKLQMDRRFRNALLVLMLRVCEGAMRGMGPKSSEQRTFKATNLLLFCLSKLFYFYFFLSFSLCVKKLSSFGTWLFRRREVPWGNVLKEHLVIVVRETEQNIWILNGKRWWNCNQNQMNKQKNERATRVTECEK